MTRNSSTAAIGYADVAVVGFGPVGQALTALLGRAGHRVVAVERWPSVFPLPRAGHVDDEVMRIFQSLSIATAIEEDSWKVTGYELRDRDGDVIANLEWGHEGLSGWYSDYSLFQPFLESLLQEQATRHPSVELLRNWQAESLERDGDGARLVLRRGSAAGGEWRSGEEVRQLRARFVVGCDGANSLVRESQGISFSDFGFTAQWLVVFAEPNDPNVQLDMPDVAQLLNPSRPTTAFRASGKRFCRWEFMLMPGETADTMSTSEVAWKLIAPWGLTPDNSRLVRHTVYTFQSLVADHWRSGPAFIAGDAAHLMPPFLGQGMCSGLRDAKTLAWKLDLVLRGLADPVLLDSYESERRPHVSSIIEASLRLGELISVTDHEAAQRRDATLRAGTLTPPEPMLELVDGVLNRDGDDAVLAPAGRLSMQPTIRVGAREGLLGDLLGDGWLVLATGFDPWAALSPRAAAVLAALDARLVRVEAEAPDGDADTDTDTGIDVDGGFLRWLGELGVRAVVVRPDFYLFAGVTGPEALDAAIDQLGRSLTLNVPTPVTNSSAD